MRKNNWAQSAAGFALGLGIGVAVGILFAPMSGEDLRDHVRDSAEDAIGGAVEQGRRLTRRAKDAAAGVIDDTVGRVSEHLTDAADAGAKAYEKARKASA